MERSNYTRRSTRARHRQVVEDDDGGAMFLQFIICVVAITCLMIVKLVGVQGSDDFTTMVKDQISINQIDSMKNFVLSAEPSSTLDILPLDKKDSQIITQQPESQKTDFNIDTDILTELSNTKK